jgi:hypothetical protein
MIWGRWLGGHTYRATTRGKKGGATEGGSDELTMDCNNVGEPIDSKN